MDSPITDDFGIISPELDCVSFEIAGVLYRKTDTLALGRGRYLEKFLTELQFEASYRGIVDAFNKGWAELNAGKLADGLFNLGLMRQKLNIVGMSRTIEAELLGLWFVAPGEDATAYDHTAFTEKVYGPNGFARLDRDFIKKKAFQLLTTTESRYPNPPEEPASEPSAKP